MSSDKDRKWARKKLLKETGREPTDAAIEQRIAERTLTLPPIDLRSNATMPVPFEPQSATKRFVTTNHVFDFDALADGLRKADMDPPSVNLAPLRGLELLLGALSIRQSGDTDAFVHEYRMMAQAVQLFIQPYLPILPPEVQQAVLTMVCNHSDEAMDMLGGKESRLLVPSRQDLDENGDRPRLDRKVSPYTQRYWSAVSWFLMAVDCRERSGMAIEAAIEDAIGAVEKRAGVPLKNLLPSDDRERERKHKANAPERNAAEVTLDAQIKRFTRYRLAFRQWKAEDAIPVYPAVVYNSQIRVTESCTEAQREKRFVEAVGHAAEGFKAANDPEEKRVNRRK